MEKKKLKKRLQDIVFDSVGNPVISYEIMDKSGEGYKSSYVDIGDVKEHNKRLLARLIEVWDII